MEGLLQQAFQVPRLRRESPGFGLYLPVSRLIKGNLPVITNLSNLLVLYLYLLFFCAIRLLFCISPNFSYRKTRIESPVIHYWFWIGFLFTFDRKFRRWSHFQNGVKKCTRRLIELNLYEELVCPLFISGQWSNGSASQNFALGSNLPVLR